MGVNPNKHKQTINRNHRPSGFRDKAVRIPSAGYVAIFFTGRLAERVGHFGKVLARLVRTRNLPVAQEKKKHQNADGQAANGDASMA